MMTQIFVLGSSSVYGVGAINGGWADLIKQELHKRMYGDGGVGEKYEMYNFGKSGATVDFVLENFPKQLEQYGRNGKTIAIVSVGGNNAKATLEPDNYVSTIEEYEEQMISLIDMLKKKVDTVIVVGGGYYDESKVSPKISPLSGNKSYFYNERKKQFEERLESVCKEKGIPFIGVEVSEEEWKKSYLYVDGLHPNQQGYQYIVDKVMEVLVSEL